MPGGEGAATLLFGSGSSFVQAGPTAAGSATFMAPYVAEPTSTGTGSLSVAIDSVLYSSASAETMSLSVIDDDGDRYLALVAFAPGLRPGDMSIAGGVLVVIPESDFAPGTTVALDGYERTVLFASGPTGATTPDLFGAALAGSVTFSSGG